MRVGMVPLVAAGLLAGVVAAAQPPPLEVAIDVMPGTAEKTISMMPSERTGVVPVAILSTATFDARQVDPKTVRLSGAQVKTPPGASRLLCEPEDVNGDGLADFVCQIEKNDLELKEGDEVTVLEAALRDGTPIHGTGAVEVVGGGPPVKPSTGARGRAGGTRARQKVR